MIAIVAACLLGAAPADPAAKARALEASAHQLQEDGQYAEAEKPLREAIALWTTLHGPNDIEVLNDEMNLAIAFRRGGRGKEAVPMLEKVVKGLAASKDRGAPQLQREALNGLAVAYQDARQPEASRATFERLLKELEQGPPSVERARVLDNLANTLSQLGDQEGAVKLARRAVGEWKALRGEEDSDVAVSMATVGTALLRLKRYGEARPLLQRALELTEKLRDKEHPEVAAALNLLGLLELQERHPAEARADFQRALKIARAAGLPDDHPFVLDARNALTDIGE